MKKLVFSIAAIALVGTPAFAADMAVKAPPAPAPLAAPWSWTGFYGGVNAGGSIGRNTTNTTNTIEPDGLPESFTVSPAGFAGGGQVGYNWQFSPNWLFGVEGDVQGLDQKETATTGSSFLVTTQQQDWFATARARFGYTNDDWLWYVTGGGAWGNIKQSFAVLPNAFFTGAPPGSVSSSTTNGGWTVGGGVETHLWGNWTAKAEYLYLDLGSISGSFVTDVALFNINTHVHDNIVRVGLNYKWGAENAYAAYAVPPASAAASQRGPVYKAPLAPAAALWSWTGFYVGVNAGGSIGRNTTNNSFDGKVPESFTVSPAGFAGGGQVGYNWQFSPNWLFGVEGDVQGLDQKETATTEFDGFLTTQQQDWFATARARFGYTNGDWLWYVTGGGAWGNIKQTFSRINNPAVTGSVSSSTTNGGGTVGGGVETHLWGNWTAKAEYLYLDLGSISGSFFDSDRDFLTINTHVHDHIVRAGINYKFN
jgi:outer membrane immunogenic protein